MCVCVSVRRRERKSTSLCEVDERGGESSGVVESAHASLPTLSSVGEGRKVGGGKGEGVWVEGEAAGERHDQDIGSLSDCPGVC